MYYVFLSDIDECLDPSNRCNFSTTICNNTDGSYMCECRPGHVDINDTTTCKGKWANQHTLNIYIQCNERGRYIILKKNDC